MSLIILTVDLNLITQVSEWYPVYLMIYASEHKCVHFHVDLWTFEAILFCFEMQHYKIVSHVVMLSIESDKSCLILQSIVC